MNKFKTVAWIIFGASIAEMFLVVFMPVLVGIITPVSAQMAAEHDMTKYPGAKEGFDYMPWVLYPLPLVIGGVAVVITLKKGD